MSKEKNLVSLGDHKAKLILKGKLDPSKLAPGEVVQLTRNGQFIPFDPNGTASEVARSLSTLMKEYEDLSNFSTNRETKVRDQLKYLGKTDDFWRDIMKEGPGFVFMIKGNGYIKTQVRTIESVGDYITRLEKSTVNSYRAQKKTQKEISIIEVIVKKYRAESSEPFSETVEFMDFKLNYYQDLRFWGLIKLAFRRLF